VEVGGLAHECGHGLGLAHTFSNDPTYRNVEWAAVGEYDDMWAAGRGLQRHGWCLAAAPAGRASRHPWRAAARHAAAIAALLILSSSRARSRRRRPMRRWDMMSYANVYSTPAAAPNFGGTGPSLIAYQQDRMGWLPAQAIYTCAARLAAAPRWRRLLRRALRRAGCSGGATAPDQQAATHAGLGPRARRRPT
jgi:hypothetical protein